MVDLGNLLKYTVLGIRLFWSGINYVIFFFVSKSIVDRVSDFYIIDKSQSWFNFTLVEMYLKEELFSLTNLTDFLEIADC